MVTRKKSHRSTQGSTSPRTIDGRKPAADSDAAGTGLDGRRTLMPPHDILQPAGAAPRARARASSKFLPRDRVAVIKILVAAACLAPFAIFIAKIAGLMSFGANPVEEVLHSMGKTGLNLLWI